MEEFLPEVKEKKSENNQSGWGALTAFKSTKDVHGDSARSFSVFTIFFILIALCGLGYYTYYKAYGAVTVTSVPVTVNLSSGLVAHWTFDTSSISGTTVTDMTYRGHNGTLVGSPGTTIGRLGQALSLNGSNQYVNVGNKNIIEDASAASVCLWLKYNAPSVTADAGLVTKWDSEGWLMWVDDVAFTSGRTNTVSFAVDAAQSGPGRVEGSTNLVVPGEWGHYCGTFQGGSYIRLYKNGVLDQQNTTSIVSVVDSNTFAIRIGDSVNAGSIKYLPGEVDDVRIYNRALSAEDIQALYELGERTKINITQTPTNLETGLVGHWTFDGPYMTSATATDVSGQSNGVTINGATRVIGKLGQALSFDGVNDSAQTAGASTDYQFPNSTFTVTGWFKKSDTSNGYIVTQGGCSGGWGVYMLSGTLRFRLKSAGSCGGDAATRNSSTTNLNDGVWHHFAAVVTSNTVVSASNDIVLYIDGSLNQGSLSRNGSPYGTTTAELLLGLSIGAGGYFSGISDDIRIYNRALSADEVAQLYRLGDSIRINITETSNNLETGLVTHYTFDGNDMDWASTTGEAENSGSVGVRGNAINFTSSAATIGKIGQALLFDGTDDYIEVGNAIKVDDSNQGTISAWIKLTPANRLFNNSDHIFNFGGAAQVNSGSFRFYVVTDGGQRLRLVQMSTGGSETRITSEQTLTVGEWHHVVISSDGTSYTMYIDGVEISFTVDSGADSGNWFADTIIPAAPVRSIIGERYFNGSYGSPFRGNMDDYRIYNRTLSADEVAQLYRLGGGR